MEREHHERVGVGDLDLQDLSGPSEEAEGCPPQLQQGVVAFREQRQTLRKAVFLAELNYL